MRTRLHGTVRKENVRERNFEHSHHLAAVEPSTCPSKGQDPAGTEAQATPASNAATRPARPPTTCSTLEILFVMVATDCVSDR